MRPSGFKHTKVTKKKISMARTGFVPTEETRDKLRYRMLGSKLSDKTKRRISLANRKMLRELGKAKSIPVVIYDVKYNSMSEAAKELRITVGKVKHRCNSNNFIDWKYDR